MNIEKIDWTLVFSFIGTAISILLALSLLRERQKAERLMIDLILNQHDKEFKELIDHVRTEPEVSNRELNKFYELSMQLHRPYRKYIKQALSQPSEEGRSNYIHNLVHEAYIAASKKQEQAI